jgi:DNA-directed RNA polymerase subunit RPC12/RpoP
LVSVVIDIRFWYDQDLSAKELFKQMVEAAVAWPLATGLSLEYRETPLPWNEAEEIINRYAEDDSSKRYSAFLTFEGWNQLETLPFQRGGIGCYIEAWGESYRDKKWWAKDGRAGSRAAIAIYADNLYRAREEPKPRHAQRTVAHNQAIVDNLALLQDLLTWMITHTRPAMVKAFRDIAAYDPRKAHLIYYRDPAQVIQDLRFMHDLWVGAEISSPMERAYWVTEEIARLVLEAGDYHTLSVSGGWLIFSQLPLFMNAHLGTLYEDLLSLAEKPIRKPPTTTAARIDELLGSFWRPLYRVRFNEIESAAKALQQYGDAALEPLIEASQHKYASVQRVAIYTLGEMGDQRATPALIQALDAADGRVRVEAATALGKLQDARAIRPLARITQRERTAPEQAAAVKSLGSFAPDNVSKYIFAALDSTHWKVRRAAIQVLEGWKDTEILIRAAEMGARGSVDAAVCLSRQRNPRAINPLIQALDDKEAPVQEQALKALKNYPERRVVSEIVTRLQTPDKFRASWVRSVAISVLRELQPHISGEEGQLIAQAISEYTDIECAQCGGRFRWGDGYYYQGGRCPHCGALVIRKGRVFWEWVGENATLNAGRRIPNELPPDADWITDEAWESGRVYGRPTPLKMHSQQGLRFDGLYFSTERHPVGYPSAINGKAVIPTLYCLRFYDNGDVILAVIACRNVEEDIPATLKWFDRHAENVSQTTYHQKGRQLHFSFNDRLVFHGLISSDGRARFSIHNQASGKKWEEVFTFWADA